MFICNYFKFDRFNKRRKLSYLFGDISDFDNNSNSIFYFHVFFGIQM
jgi:hypothetical protein